jgi:hypothetical protein
MVIRNRRCNERDFENLSPIGPQRQIPSFGMADEIPSHDSSDWEYGQMDF